MYSVEFAYNIVPSDEAGQGLSNLLIRQLAAIESGKGLQQAARSLGVSYRYFCPADPPLPAGRWCCW